MKLLFLAAFAALSAIAAQARNGSLVYVGTYTDSGSKGIYAFRFDSANGTLAPLGLVAETANPTFLAVHPTGRFLYAVNELDSFEGAKTGAVSGFAIDRDTGKLTLLKQVPSGGGGPCHVTVDHTGRYVLIANYTGGTITSLPISKDGGLGTVVSSVRLKGSGPDHERQEGPHPHFTLLSHDNRRVIACDLGADKVLVYDFDPANGRLADHYPAFVPMKPGSGPRHFVFDRTEEYGYLVNELSSTVSAFAWHSEEGTLAQIQTISSLAPGFSGTTTAAEIALAPSGRFLYASNRGENTIAMFTVDRKTGGLKSAGRAAAGGRPRSFAIDPAGKWLIAANQDTNSLVVFRIGADGKLVSAGAPVACPSPVCVQFLADH